MKKLCLLILSTVLQCTAAFAANLTISPAIITNDYAGKITFTITGIGLEEGVRLEKFIDLNANGVLDSTDMMCQSYRVRDGRQYLIGGVRNINMPCDEDGATNGQIITKIWYPGISAGVDLIAGTYLFRVTTESMALATNILVVEQKSYPQGVSGQVTISGSSQPLPYTPVVLVPGNSGPVTGTITDSSGNYTLYSPAGGYMVLALRPGYVGDFSGGTAVAPGTFSTVNLGMPTFTRIISGKLQDSLSATGLAGVFLQAESGAGQFVSTFTDVRGYYSLALTDGTWKLEPDGGHMAQAGYIGWMTGTNVTVSGSDVTNVVLACAKANALVYGRAVNNMAQPVWGLGITGNDPLHVLNPRGRLFPTNGNYCLGVSAGNWSIGFDSDTLQALGYVGSYSNVTLSANQAMQVDFTLVQYNAHILGRVVDNNSNGVGNVEVTGNAQNGQTQAQTDANGYFDLPVFGGTWQLGISQEDLQREGLVLNTNLSLTITNGENRSNVLMVVQRASTQLCGRVQDGTGAGVAGVSVHVWIDGSSTMVTVPTDSGGNFCAAVFGGDWQIAVEQSDLQSRGLLSWNPPTVTVVDGQNQNGITITVQSITGQINGTVYDNLGAPVVGLGVWGFATINNIQYGQYAWTDNNGYFSLAVCNGFWEIDLDCWGDGGLQWRGYECQQNIQTNFSGGTTTINFTVSPPIPLQITTTNLPNGTVGQWYSQQLTAIGGEFPYNWCLVNNAGALPPGLELSINGQISGTPTTPGDYHFGARAYDFSSIADTNLSIRIQDTTANKPQITQYWRAGAGQFDLVIENLTSGQYQIQLSTNLGAGWSTLVTTNVTATTLHIHDPGANNAPRFYRVYRP